MSKNQLLTKLNNLESLLRKKDDKPLNFVEAAQYLSLSHSTLYKLTYQRKIPCHKPNGKVLYFFKHELDEWISSNAECRTKNVEKKDDRKEDDVDEDESG